MNSYINYIIGRIKISLILIITPLDSFGRCRWSTNTDEPLLFIKYRVYLLYILDAEKKALTSKRPIELDPDRDYSFSLFYLFSSLYNVVQLKRGP